MRHMQAASHVLVVTHPTFPYQYQKERAVT